MEAITCPLISAWITVEHAGNEILCNIKTEMSLWAMKTHEGNLNVWYPSEMNKSEKATYHIIPHLECDVLENQNYGSSKYYEDRDCPLSAERKSNSVKKGELKIV